MVERERISSGIETQMAEAKQRKKRDSMFSLRREEAEQRERVGWW